MAEETKEVKLSENAKKVMEMVEKMTVLELNDLVKALEDKFGVTAAAPMMMGAMQAANGNGAEAEPVERGLLERARDERRRGVPALLAVHRSYLSCVLPLVENSLLSAMSHITGGGFPDNLPRVLPEGLDAVVHPGAWSWPPLFRLLQDKGRIAPAEMLRVFNCGIGMVLIVPPARGLEVKTRLDASGEDWKQIGRVQKGERKVRFV